VNEKEYLALRDKAQSLRAKSPKEAIIFLKDAFNSTFKDLLAINTLLGVHYTLSDMHEEEGDLRRFVTRLCPDEPLAWTSLTEFLIFTKENLDEAEEAAQNALKCAEKAGEYVRLCYNNFARIARRQNDYRRLEECLVFLIDYQPSKGKRDINYERDFLIGIDESKIDSALVKKYNLLAK